MSGYQVADREYDKYDATGNGKCTNGYAHRSENQATKKKKCKSDNRSGKYGYYSYSTLWPLWQVSTGLNKIKYAANSVDDNKQWDKSQ